MTRKTCFKTNRRTKSCVKLESVGWQLISGDVFPKVYWRGPKKGKMYTVEELVGPSLQEVFVKYQKSQFSKTTIALIGMQVVAFE